MCKNWEISTFIVPHFYKVSTIVSNTAIFNQENEVQSTTAPKHHFAKLFLCDSLFEEMFFCINKY